MGGKTNWVGGGRRHCVDEIQNKFVSGKVFPGEGHNVREEKFGGWREAPLP